MSDETPVDLSTPPEEKSSEALSLNQAAERIARMLSAKEDAPPASEGPPKPDDGKAVDGKPGLPPEAKLSYTTPRRYKVNVDGQESEVEEAELIRGYSREPSFTRKSQALAAERKSFEVESTGVRTERERYKTILPQLEGLVQQAVDQYKDVDWERLRAEDPAAFAEHRAAYQLQQERLAMVKSERETVDIKLAEEQAMARGQYQAQELVLLVETIPEWADTAKRDEDLDKIGAWARKSIGFKAEELKDLDDHRAYRVLRMAYLYSQLEANAKSAGRKVDQVKQAVAPGVKKPEGSADGKAFETARARLRKTGRVDDAATAIQAILDRESA
jgi:hypothetical protein